MRSARHCRFSTAFASVETFPRVISLRLFACHLFVQITFAALTLVVTIQYIFTTIVEWLLLFFKLIFIWDWVFVLFAGVAWLHSKGIIHRDIRLANGLVLPNAAWSGQGAPPELTVACIRCLIFYIVCLFRIWRLAFLSLLSSLILVFLQRFRHEPGADERRHEILYATQRRRLPLGVGCTG
jgi:hypothetical protein